MSGGLFGLLDDIAALAKLAAASVDDVGLAAGRASVKAAGVVVDDTAVTPAYVHGLAAERELPIIKRIAKGSLRNKLLLILPVALALSSVAPLAVELILMAGGTYLAYEGAHKIKHRWDHRHLTTQDADTEPSAADIDVLEREEAEELFGPDHEEATVKGAIRTDLILSAEIMVIALKEVLDQGLLSRATILAVVAVVITVGVYGLVALIVKMDDIGLHLVENGRPTSARFGRGLVHAMPKVLATLAAVGTAAMCWVGGHILLTGSAELGWNWPHEQVMHLEDAVHHVAFVGGVAAWTVDTLMSAATGLLIGAAAVSIAALGGRMDQGTPAGH